MIIKLKKHFQDNNMSVYTLKVTPTIPFPIPENIIAIQLNYRERNRKFSYY
jgi:hypothetical protein